MSSPQARILVVDDKPNMLKLMVKVLRSAGDVLTAGNGATAVSLLEGEPIDVVLCDLRMPDMTGLEVMRASARLQPRAKFILMTAYATVQTAVTALKDGAYDYLTKPFEPEQAEASVIRALRSVRPRAAVADHDQLLPGLHGASPGMRELAGIVRTLAASRVNILIVGESGSGKARMGRAIHRLANDTINGLHVVDCRTLAGEGLASVCARLCTPNPDGTVLLSGVDKLSPTAQAQLARALNNRASGTSQAPPPRLLSTTTRDLDRCVAEDEFRRDLQLKLAVAVVMIPPLRARAQDIPVLVAHLLSEAQDCGATGHEIGFSSSAMEKLVAARWPGNVAELRAAVFQAATLAQGDAIEVEALPTSLHPPHAAEVAWETLSWADALARGRDDIARRYLIALLRRFCGDIVSASSQAGVERESFYRLLRKHGISPEGFRPPDGDPTSSQ